MYKGGVRLRIDERRFGGSAALSSWDISITATRRLEHMSRVCQVAHSKAPPPTSCRAIYALAPSRRPTTGISSGRPH